MMAKSLWETIRHLSHLQGALLPPLLALGVLVWAWHWQKTQAAAVMREQRRATHGAELASAILQLRQKPQIYEERIVDAHRLAGAVEEAARRAAMQQTQILAIRPEHPRRITDTPYVESFTRVRLGRVSMRQLAALVWILDHDMPGLAIPELRVWAEGSEGEVWEAEIGLAGLAYMPMDSLR